jgi:small GTP-binding protein
MIRETIQAKVTVIGNANVGKSSLIQRFVSDEHLENHEPTIGATFLSRLMEFNNKSLKLNIWDTAGQERYNSLAASYARDSRACLLVYDITNFDSFKALERWYENLTNHLGGETVLVVVGNKEDLVSQEGVTIEEALEYAKSIRASHFRVSARSGVGVEELFIEVSKRILNDPNLTQKEQNRTTRGLSLYQHVAVPKKKKCC